MGDGGFQLPEYPRSGSKAMIVEKDKERKSVLTMVREGAINTLRGGLCLF